MFTHTKEHRHTKKQTNIKRSTDVKATTRRCRNVTNNQSIMSTGRVPLNDGENLAVGAFGGIVETVVQSTYTRYRFVVDTRVVVDDSFISSNSWIKDEK